jgi:hypothetical protein
MAFKGHRAWNKGKKFPKIFVDKKKLYKLYIVQKKPIKEVAKILGLTYSTTRNRLFKYEWIRNLSESLKGHGIDKETREKISNSLKGNIAWNKGLTKQTDSRITTTKGAWEKGHIPWNKNKKGLIPWNKGKKFMALDKNPNWKGGKSFEPYGLKFNKKLKNKIRERDKYRCQECFRHQGELYDKVGRKYKLIVHHIDYDKNNNEEENLISLCRNCHLQTNFGREDWTKYYKEVLCH